MTEKITRLDTGQLREIVRRGDDGTIESIRKRHDAACELAWKEQNRKNDFASPPGRKQQHDLPDTYDNFSTCFTHVRDNIYRANGTNKLFKVTTYKGKRRFTFFKDEE